MGTKIKYRVLLVCILSAASIRMSAIDFVSVDPLWQMAVIDGTNKVLDKYNTQNDKLLKIAALQNTISLHFNPIKEWQRKYNDYLKNAESYAEAFNAGSRLTSEAVRTIRDLMDLKKVMGLLTGRKQPADCR